MAGRGHGLGPEPLRDLQGADHQGWHAGETGGVHGVGIQGQRLHLRHHLPLHLPLLCHYQAGAGSPAQQVQWRQMTHLCVHQWLSRNLRCRKRRRRKSQNKYFFYTNFSLILPLQPLFNLPNESVRERKIIEFELLTAHFKTVVLFIVREHKLEETSLPHSCLCNI